MWTYNNGSNELYHYGVIGMKWGVRRFRANMLNNRAARYKSQANYEAKARRAGIRSGKATTQNLQRSQEASDRYNAKAAAARAKAKAILGKNPPMKKVKNSTSSNRGKSAAHEITWKDYVLVGVGGVGVMKAMNKRAKNDPYGFNKK